VHQGRRPTGQREPADPLELLVQGRIGRCCHLVARGEQDPPSLLEPARQLRRAEAQARLREAPALAEDGGMRLLGQRARDELLGTGARPRRSALSGPAALTPAEHRIAVLAAEGQSNRAIAERLYVTQRTVETHLTHAFAKLQITTRTDLPRAMEALPLLSARK
jgi:DNA-binding NarL/FixJ family response regulator